MATDTKAEIGKEIRDTYRRMVDRYGWFAGPKTMSRAEEIVRDRAHTGPP